jgi:hypothetical protein
VPAVTYFVRMVARDGKPDEVLELLLGNPESEDAVEAHESGEAFERYKRDLRPLVEPDNRRSR